MELRGKDVKNMYNVHVAKTDGITHPDGVLGELDIQAVGKHSRK